MDTIAPQKGNIQVIKDYKLDLLQERFNKNDKIKGFRIQIHSDIRKETARKAKSQFLMLYPNVKSYEDYQQPNFNVKVGDFMTKLEAKHFHNKLVKDFPNCYIFQDFIVPYEHNEY